jgi:hypothetical protein
VIGPSTKLTAQNTLPGAWFEGWGLWNLPSRERLIHIRILERTQRLPDQQSLRWTLSDDVSAQDRVFV